jgi:hypothetical protein
MDRLAVFHNINAPIEDRVEPLFHDLFKGNFPIELLDALRYRFNVAMLLYATSQEIGATKVDSFSPDAVRDIVVFHTDKHWDQSFNLLSWDIGGVSYSIDYEKYDHFNHFTQLNTEGVFDASMGILLNVFLYGDARGKFKQFDEIFTPALELVCDKYEVPYDRIDVTASVAPTQLDQ